MGPALTALGELAEALRAGPGHPVLGALLAAHGVPTVLYGPSGGGAHGRDEWVDLASVERVARVLGEVAARFCA